MNQRAKLIQEIELTSVALANQKSHLYFHKVYLQRFVNKNKLLLQLAVPASLFVANKLNFSGRVMKAITRAGEIALLITKFKPLLK